MTMSSLSRKILLLGACAALPASLLLYGAVPGRAEEAPRLVPAFVQTNATAVPAENGSRTITFSGGCFWGVQGVFEHVKGVRKAVAGYTGGQADTAQYETVSTGTTGHAESVQVTYDPQAISLARLMQIYFSVALDPTEVNEQGPDTGTQYRSEIWTSSPAEAQAATAYIAQLDATHTYGARIATRVDPLQGFYPAETYHQDYLAHNPDAAYIAINDMPKVEALKRLFPQDYRATPVLALPSTGAT
ncbi:peptide-methionine (S)-S-oxide reductase MsrA [Lichenicola sp.]|uniref:peptide-methionine (S)-S-oxide reductase MsrA n=1 Tax=Lichenicola sp. TaxID=2804529 RepID=UPI003AFFD665